MKLLLLLVLFGSATSHALICKTADGKLALVLSGKSLSEKSLIAICNPVMGKNSTEVCGKDSFVLANSSVMNGVATDSYSSINSKLRPTITVTHEEKSVTVDVSADYEVQSFESENTITAPKGISKLSCK